MNFENIDGIKSHGFQGFVAISPLQDSACSDVPRRPGIYLVVQAADSPPKYLSKSIGGHFKKKDPTVSISELQGNWVDGPVVLYIGKAGGSGSSAMLRSRLLQYMQFGAGKPIGHWGGRYIWQIAGSGDLLVCWKPLEGEEPKAVESQLNGEFIQRYGKLPFANLQR